MRPAIITGSIGTGKSTVCKRLSKMGVKVIDADLIAHKVLDENALQICEMFGKECLFDGKVDRKILGKIVFNDPKKRQILEEFIHPIIHKDLLDEWQKSKDKNEDAILDIPLYFESKNRYEGFFIVVVYAPKEQQIKRLKERNNLSMQEIQKRLDAQLPIEKKCKMADWVVDNSKDLKSLEEEIQSLYKWLKEDNAYSKI
jgi:dephospho-CoA kinase